MDLLFHAHVDLLLSAYDTLDWGAWETKVKTCVPQEKQNHLLSYFTKSDFPSIETAVKTSMKLFDTDAKEIFTSKNLDYPSRIAEQVMDYFKREINI